MRRPWRALALVALAVAACSAGAEAPATESAPALPSGRVKDARGPGPIDHARMVAIPAGAFPMGRPEADPGTYGAEWKQNELPQHVVTLAAFEIDRDEVTVAEYARFLDAWGDPSAEDPHQPIARAPDGAHAALLGAESLPVAFVSWFEAYAFCALAGKSLPTEAEWERAAKGASGDRRFPWGDAGPVCSQAVFMAQARCESAPVAVGSRSPKGDSPEGARDLAGNVAEWVLDWYGDYPSAKPVADPRGPEQGTLRVLRGGNAFDPAAAIWLEEGADAGAGKVSRVALGGGAPEALARGFTRPAGLAVTSARAYVTADAFGDAGGSVFAVADGGAEPLAGPGQRAFGLAADPGAGVVYWAARKGRQAGAQHGFLWRTPTDGGASAPLAEAPSGADRVAVRGPWVLFTNSQTLMRVRATGGPREDLAIHTSVDALVTTGGAAYWTDPAAGKLYELTVD